jgi:hypothetical protein
MSALATEEDDKIVPLFMSYEDFEAAKAEICAEHLEQWQALGRVWKAQHAAIDADTTELAKYDAPEVALAKADASRLLAKNHNNATAAKLEATLDLHAKWQEITIKRNDRLFGIGAVAKRSARFASARRRPIGASATVLPYSGKAR